MGVIREPRPCREALRRDVVEELGSSLDLGEVMQRAYPLLAKLVPADHGALCVSREGQPDEYDWIVALLPDAIFGGYAELAGHDFVRHAVEKRPNVVLRDHDMISRGELEQNALRRRWRELGVSVEQIMAVFVDLGAGVRGGLTLYRDRRRPFSDRELDAVQGLVRPLAHAEAPGRQV